MITRIIRWILTVALIYGVYTEAGKWTALALTLVAILSEGLAWAITRNRKNNELA